MDFFKVTENGAFFARLLNNAVFVENKIINIVSKGKLTLNDTKILYSIAYLSESNKSTIKNISDYLYLSPASCSRTVNQLIKNKYVVLTKSKVDKRVSYLYLTEESKEFLNQINLYHVRLYYGLKDSFDNQKLLDTLEVLKKLDNLVVEQKLL